MRQLPVSAGLVLAFAGACLSPARPRHNAVAKHRNTSHTRGGSDDLVLVPLADSLAPLQDCFNADKGKPRLVAVLSPT